MASSDGRGAREGAPGGLRGPHAASDTSREHNQRAARVSGSSSAGARGSGGGSRRVSGSSRPSGAWSRHSDEPETPLPGDVEEFVASFGGLLVRESDIVGEHSRLLTTYKSSFIGASLVDFLVQRRYCDDRLAAIELCNTLMEYGVFRVVSGARCVTARSAACVGV